MSASRRYGEGGGAHDEGALTFSSIFSAGLGGAGGILKPRSSNIFSAAFRLATFLLAPSPSAVRIPTFTCKEQRDVR